MSDVREGEVGPRGHMPLLPVCRPYLGGREFEHVTECLRSGWISSSGPQVAELERRFADWIGVRHAVAVTSGTAALHIACAALGLGPGDEVIVPDFTMIAPAFAVCYTGARPVFADAESATWTMDAGRVAEAITPRTRAILAAHVYGHPCEMDALRALAARRGIALVEDAAEAIGSQVRGALCGRLGDIGCFSFFANKVMTTGEGGMVVTDSTDLAARCRSLRNLSFAEGGARVFYHQSVGFNYRMTSLTAALGLAQLERVDDYVAMRRKNAASYSTRLAGAPGLTLPPEMAWARSSYWMYGILVDETVYGESAGALMGRLRRAGIETRPFFTPLHRQPALRDLGCDCEGRYPVADALAERGLYLPSSTDLSEAEIDRVCRAVLRC